MRLFWVVVLSLLLVACTGGRAEHNVTVIIPEGASLSKAAEVLEQAGAVESASGFLNHARFFGSSASIKPGEYEVKAGMDSGDVLTLLQSGKTKQYFVTVTEGMPSIMVYERLMANKNLTGTIDVPAEGSVLPDTYAIKKGESRAAVLARMQAAMTQTLAELWEQRSPSTVVKSPQEAVTLAAIVEKETAKHAERRRVAGVYSNRLKIGMKLQADPTTIYPITKGKPLGRRILKSEIAAVNGYNTYSMVGLPVGPITNPGKASIAAVLNPEKNDYLYFVADGTGGHVFAKTLDEHNANVEKWYAIRRQRGEM